MQNNLDLKYDSTNGKLVRFDNWGELLEEVRKFSGQKLHEMQPSYSIAYEAFGRTELHKFELWYIMAKRIEEIEAAAKDIVITPDVMLTGISQKTYVEIQNLLSLLKTKS